jgi:hypothetical protein
VADQPEPRRGGKRLTAGSATVARPIDEDEPRNTLPNIERREEADEHASSKLEDVFDRDEPGVDAGAQGPHAVDGPIERGQGGAGRVDPSIPTPDGSRFAGTVGLR